MRHVYFLVLRNTHVLDLAGPLQIVSTLLELGIADIKIDCIGPEPSVRLFQHAMLSNLCALPKRLPAGAVVFVVGSKIDDGLIHSKGWAEAAKWLSVHAADGANGLQVCGVCTGSFLLAHAGLLDGRVCTTHHRLVPQLRRFRPAAHVTENRIFVQDQHVWTSAGVASGIDLALRLIADYFGDDAAVQVARENVVHFRRLGGDPALDAFFRHRAHGNSLVHAVQDIIARDLSQQMNYDQLGKSVGYSGRHLARIFVAETGTTIKRFQTELRIDKARRLLKESKLSLERIAEESGFASVQAFRSNWDQQEALPPSAMRPERRRRC